MKPFKIVAIDDCRDFLTALEITVTKKLGSNYTFQGFESFPGIDALTAQDPGLLLLDYTLPGRFTGLDIARQLQTNPTLHRVPRILITGAEPRERMRVADLALQDGEILQGILVKAGREFNLERIIQTHQKFPMTLGFLGLGKLGRECLAGVFGYNKDILEKAIAYSPSGAHSEELTRQSTGIRSSLLKFTSTLEEFMSYQPDVILSSFSLGKAGVQNAPGRNQLWNEEEKECHSAVIREVFRLEQGLTKKPLYIEAANPVGIRTAHLYKLGIAKDRLTGLSAVDTFRVKSYLEEAYFKQYGTAVPFEDISVLVVGQHGLEVPLKNTISIRGKSLEELGISLDMDAFTQGIRGEGKLAMRAVAALEQIEQTEAAYYEVPTAFVGMMKELFRHKQPSMSLYAFGDLTIKTGGITIPYASLFFNGPVELEYAHRAIHIKPKVLSRELFTSAERRLFVKEAVFEEGQQRKCA